MNRIVGNRAERASRSKTSQAKHDWLTAEQIGEHFGRSGDTIRGILCDMKLGCAESKKPTEESFKTHLARKYRSNGKTLYKWHRSIILLVKEYLNDSK